MDLVIYSPLPAFLLGSACLCLPLPASGCLCLPMPPLLPLAMLLPLPASTPRRRSELLFPFATTKLLFLFDSYFGKEDKKREDTVSVLRRDLPIHARGTPQVLKNSAIRGMNCSASFSQVY